MADVGQHLHSRKVTRFGLMPNMSQHNDQAANSITATLVLTKSLKWYPHMPINCSFLPLSNITQYSTCHCWIRLMTTHYLDNTIHHHRQLSWITMKNGMWKRSWIHAVVAPVRRGFFYFIFYFLSVYCRLVGEYTISLARGE